MGHSALQSTSTHTAHKAGRERERKERERREEREREREGESTHIQYTLLPNRASSINLSWGRRGKAREGRGEEEVVYIRILHKYGLLQPRSLRTLGLLLAVIRSVGL